MSLLIIERQILVRSACSLVTTLTLLSLHPVKPKAEMPLAPTYSVAAKMSVYALID